MGMVGKCEVSNLEAGAFKETQTEDGECLHDHLLATQKSVANEFAGAQRDGLLLVGHICSLSE